MDKKITKEDLERKLREIYGDKEWPIQRCEWEEDGQVYHMWKVKMDGRAVYTNDAGYSQINESIRKLVTEYAQKNTHEEINNSTEEDRGTQTEINDQKE